MISNVTVRRGSRTFYRGRSCEKAAHIVLQKLGIAPKRRRFQQNDLVYLAGYIDGEGCFSFGKNYKPCLSVTNTHRPTIEWLHRTFGGNVSRGSKPRKPNHRPTYTWAIVSREAVNLAAAVVVHLKEKTPQALLLIAVGQTMGPPGHHVPPEVMSERQRFATFMKETKRVTW